MLGKKLYSIVISGESEGYTEKYLTDAEAALIKEIFEETSSTYIECIIEEIPDKEEYEDDFLSMIASGTLSEPYIINKIAEKYDISYGTAEHIYSQYK